MLYLTKHYSSCALDIGNFLNLKKMGLLFSLAQPIALSDNFPLIPLFFGTPSIDSVGPAYAFETVCTINGKNGDFFISIHLDVL